MPPGPDRAGFVLAGGSSRRMGRDKALLPYLGATLVEYIAGEVRRAAGSSTLVGPASRYRALGLPVVEDLRPDAGPLAGIEAALASTAAGWNLIVACDMPGVSAGLFDRLFVRCIAAGAPCLIPAAPDGRLQPLCAVYRRDCLAAVRAALDSGIRKVADAIGTIAGAVFEPLPASCLRNANTPGEWAEV